MIEDSFSNGAAVGGDGRQQEDTTNTASSATSGGQQHMNYGYKKGGQPSDYGGTIPSHFSTSIDHHGGADRGGAPLHRHHGGRRSAAAGRSHSQQQQQQHQQHQQRHLPIHHYMPPPMYLPAYQQPTPPYYPQQQLSASFQQPPPQPRMTPASGSVGGAAAGHANAPDAFAGIEIPAPYQEDIERGLSIDFFAEKDPTLLASWASFFRDRFIEVRHELKKATFDRNAETYRRATHFAERVESKILVSSAAKQLFRRYPLTPMNDPFFVDTCYRTIIDYTMRNPPFDGFTFGNPAWRDYMWFKVGLINLVNDSRNSFLKWYAEKIQHSIDIFIETNVSSKTSKKEKGLLKKLIPEAILEASNSGMSNKASYNHAKTFYAFLYKEVLLELEVPEDAPSELTGKRVREVFSVAEEAFVLAVLRSHLDMMRSKNMHLRLQKQKVENEQSGGPPPQDTPSSHRDEKSASPSFSAFSDVLTNAVEISRMLASQEVLLGFDSPLIHFN